MDNKIKWSIAAVAIVGIVVIVVGLGILFPSNKQDKEIEQTNLPDNNTRQDITIRYFAWYFSPLEIADELGYLKEEGIKLEYLGVFRSGPEDIIVVSTEKSDFGNSAWPALINAASKGVKIKTIIANGGIAKNTPQLTWLVLEDSGIKTASDLKGKVIGISNFGAHPDYTTYAYLKKNGVPKEEVQLIVVPYENTEQALRQHRVDVIAAWEPTASKIREGGGVRVLFTDYDVMGELFISGNFVSEKFIKENPDGVKRLLRAYVKAYDWTIEHPEETKRLGARILEKRGDNPEIAKYWKGFGERPHSLVADNDIQFFIDWMTNDGKLKEGQVKPSDVYTNEFNPYYK